jgi:AGZA family xanthine/uracil permease-like MFS transporter
MSVNRANLGFGERLDLYFGITEKGSSVAREILAGVSTFLALSYIFVVNPAILAQGGMDKSAVFFATVLTSGLATLAMGLWARLPFAVAPGMEMNAFVAFFAIGALGFTWQEALGMVFWSGVVMVALTLASVRERVIDSIPPAMKVGLAFSVGIFLILIALSISGILRYEGLGLRGVGNLFTAKALALVIGLALALLLSRMKVVGAVLLGILITAAVCQLALGLSDPPAKAISLSPALLGAVGELRLDVLLNPKSLSVVLVLFVLDFYGSVAKFIGLTLSTNVAEDGNVPRRKQALLVDGVGTVGGATLGTSSVIAYVESAVGIGLGGRTGFVAVVCGSLMLATFALAPALQLIPLAATTGTLVFVGLQLLPKKAAWQGLGMFDRVVLVLMPLVVIATFAIDRAMLVGFTLYLVKQIVERKVNWFLAASTALLWLAFLLQLR